MRVTVTPLEQHPDDPANGRPSRGLDFNAGLRVHVEVVYSVAAELGYYADDGVRVSIRDGVRWDDDRLRQAAVVGLGRTLLIRLLSPIERLPRNVARDIEKPRERRRSKAAPSALWRA